MGTEVVGSGAAGVSPTNEENIHEINEALASSDFGRFFEGVHPDALWEHNLGSGSPEEGVYEGREQIRKLFERILVGWEYMRPRPTEIRELEPGVYLVRGELHCKHPATENVFVERYEQRLEVRDGLLVKGRMTTVSDSETVAIIRRFSDAFNRLDIDSVIDWMDPEIELREWPTGPGAHVYHGTDGVRRAIDSWFESWEWMRIEILELLEADDRVLVTAYQRAQGKGSKIEVEIKSFNVYTFRDGKVVRIELFTERAAALEAAGLVPHYEEENR